MSGTPESLEKARLAQQEKKFKNRTSIQLTGHARVRKKKLQKQFLQDLLDFWTGEWVDPKSEPDESKETESPTNGQMLIRLAASTNPADIVKMVAAMVPKEVPRKVEADGKPKATKKSILDVMRGMEQDDRVKKPAIEVESRSGTPGERSVESKALGALAGKSPLRSKR